MKYFAYLASFIFAMLVPMHVAADNNPINRIASLHVLRDGPSYDWCGYDNHNIYSNGTLHLAAYAIRANDVVVECDDDGSGWPNNVLRCLFNSITIQNLNTANSTLDIYCGQRNIKLVNFFKVCNQTNPWNVIHGADGLISRGAVDFIQFRYGNFFQSAQITLEQVYSYLTSKGYAIYRVSGLGLIPILEWRHALENYRFSEYVAVRIVPTKL